MRDPRDEKAENADRSRHIAASPDDVGKGRLKFADEEVPLRAPRVEADGRYDLSWDGVSGGCGTDERY